VAKELKTQKLSTWSTNH